MMQDEKREGWMDSVCFYDELGRAKGGEKVYPSEQNLRENSKCVGTDGTCTALRVYVFDADRYDRYIFGRERALVELALEILRWTGFRAAPQTNNR